MKKYVLVVVLFMLFAGVATGSSINGDYKGNPIVNVKVNGKMVSSEVPAIIYDGSTLIPLRAATEALGATVSWDQTTYTASINISSNDTNPNTKESFKKLLDKAESYGSIYFHLTYDSIGAYLATSYKLKNDGNDIDNIHNLTTLVAYTDADYIDIKELTADNADLAEIIVNREDAENFLSGKLDKTAYFNKWQIKNNSAQSSQQSPAVSFKQPLKLYSNDGKVFLGTLSTNQYDSDSIYNQYGDYGSKYSDKSIWNSYGDYGSKYSSKSAFNDFATEPPIIVDENGKIVGYLTTNNAIKGAISPVGLKESLTKLGY
jgi:hypothetical protein